MPDEQAKSKGADAGKDAGREDRATYIVTLDVPAAPRTVEQIGGRGIPVLQLIEEFGIAFVKATPEEAKALRSLQGVVAVEPEGRKAAI